MFSWPEFWRAAGWDPVLRFPVDLECRRGTSLLWGMGVSWPSAAGEGGGAGRGGMGRAVGFCFKSGKSSSFLNTEGVEIEGEGDGGITLTFRLEQPSDGMSSGAASVVGGRSRAGVILINVAFFCTDGLREWLCRGEDSAEDAFELLVSFAKKLGAISPSLSSFLYLLPCLK